MGRRRSRQAWRRAKIMKIRIPLRKVIPIYMSIIKLDISMSQMAGASPNHCSIYLSTDRHH